MTESIEAVLLAAGRGTRLRSRHQSAATGNPLTPEQEEIAEEGIKALIPIRRAAVGRSGSMVGSGSDGKAVPVPFVTYLLEALRDASVTRVVVVVPGSDIDRVRRFPTVDGVELDFAVQTTPLGTADALLAAEARVGTRQFLVLNADTHYPTSLLRALVDLDGPGLVALDGHRVASDPRSNLSIDQMAHWAHVSVDAQGDLDSVLPPPDSAPPPPWRVNINAWRFGQEIFDACRRIEAAASGEFELPNAVELSRTLPSSSSLAGACTDSRVRYRVLTRSDSVLDLTSRDDIPVVERLLAEQRRYR